MRLKALFSLLASLLLIAAPVSADDMLDEYRGTLEVGKPERVTALKFPGKDQESTTLSWVSTELDLNGATEVATSLIPAGSTYLGCVARVTEVVTGATTWDLGDGSDQDLWANDVALTLGTVTSEADFTADPRGFSASAVSPTLTANGSNFTDGKIRISCR